MDDATLIVDQVRELLLEVDDVKLDGIIESHFARRITSYARRHHIRSGQEFLRRLREDSEVREGFVTAMTINVTKVYRNPRAWQRLEGSIAHLSDPLRIWSAGCSKGAEAYSLAAMCRLAGREAEIFATDYDTDILYEAEIGEFTKLEMSEAPEAVVDTFFEKTDSGWAVDPELKRDVTFSRQDLITDPVPTAAPFDLILCRNVLIYFTETAQLEVCRRFAGSLVDTGILLVGAAEHIWSHRDMGLTSVAHGLYRWDAENVPQQADLEPVPLRKAS